MPAGRPTLFNPEVGAKIVELLRLGNYRCAVARSVGIGPRTLARWISEGKSEESPFHSFRQAVIAAEAEAEIYLVALVRKAALKSADVARWFLMHRYPDRWGRNSVDVKNLAKALAELERERGLNGGTGQ